MVAVLNPRRRRLVISVATFVAVCIAAFLLRRPVFFYWGDRGIQIWCHIAFPIVGLVAAIVVQEYYATRDL